MFLYCEAFSWQKFPVCAFLITYINCIYYKAEALSWQELSYLLIQAINT